jgi:hypothetical protein
MRFISKGSWLGLLVVLGSSIALGQHGGGHGGNGHAGGFAHQGGLIPARSAARPPVLPTPIGFQRLAGAFTGINPGALRSHSNGRRDGVGVGFLSYPYLGYGGGFGYGDNSFVNPPSDPSQDSAEQTAEVTANMLGEQIQRLSSEIEQLRNSREQPPPPADVQAAPTEPEDAAAASPITLVLHTGQRIQVKNYAVMDHVFWDFSNQTPRRIALSAIDIPASEKATEAAGNDFPQLR